MGNHPFCKYRRAAFLTLWLGIQISAQCASATDGESLQPTGFVVVAEGLEKDVRDQTDAPSGFFPTQLARDLRKTQLESPRLPAPLKKLPRTPALPEVSGPLVESGSPCEEFKDLASAKASDLPAFTALPFDVFEPSTPLLIEVRCEATRTKIRIGRDDGGTIIYKQAFVRPLDRSTGWTPYPLEIHGQEIDRNWFIGTGILALDDAEAAPGRSYEVIAVMCKRNADAWRCGCRTPKSCGM